MKNRKWIFGLKATAKMTQIMRVQVWLTKHRSINPLDAWRFLGIYRLGSVVHVLRKRYGADAIKTDIMNIKNHLGENVSPANYTIKRGLKW